MGMAFRLAKEAGDSAYEQKSLSPVSDASAGRIASLSDQKDLRVCSANVRVSSYDLAHPR